MRAHLKAACDLGDEDPAPVARGDQVLERELDLALAGLPDHAPDILHLERLGRREEQALDDRDQPQRGLAFDPVKVVLRIDEHLGQEHARGRRCGPPRLPLLVLAARVTAARGR